MGPTRGPRLFTGKGRGNPSEVLFVGGGKRSSYSHKKAAAKHEQQGTGLDTKTDNFLYRRGSRQQQRGLEARAWWWQGPGLLWDSQQEEGKVREQAGR